MSKRERKVERVLVSGVGKENKGRVLKLEKIGVLVR